MVLGIDYVAGTQKVPREEHVMNRRGAQEWREGIREKGSLTRYYIAEDGGRCWPKQGTSRRLAQVLAMYIF